MDSTKQFLEKVKAMPLPMPIAALEKLFTDHYTRYNIDAAYVAEFDQTRQQLLATNLPELIRKLQQTSIEVLLTLKEFDSATWIKKIFDMITAKKSPTDMCRATLRNLRLKIEQQLEKEAANYYPESSPEYRSIPFALTSTELIQNNLTGLFSAQELKLVLTKDLVTAVYEATVSNFEGLTQSQFFSRERNSISVLRECFIEKLALGLDILTSGSMQKKAMKLVGKMRMKQMCRILEYTFLEELKTCRSRTPMDWDLDPTSPKGKTLHQMCIWASDLRNPLPGMQEFVEMCLSRCYDRSRYTNPPDTYDEHELCACLCRLFIGFLDFQGVLSQSSPALCCHPEVYLWLKRLLKFRYRYPQEATWFIKPRPQEAAYFENRFLNALCKAAGQKLAEMHCLRRVDQGILYPEELIPETPHPIDSPPLTNDMGKLLQLNTINSLTLVVHASGYTSESDSPTESWVETKKCKVSREALTWRAGTVSSAISYGPLASAVLLLTPIGRTLQLISIAAGAVVEVLNSAEQFRTTQLTAKHVGQYLARLIIHKRLQNRFISLISYSLGTQVILSCLHELGLHNLAHPDKAAYITDVVLILGAVEIDSVDWNLVTSVVKGRFLNVYSREDQVLRRVFSFVGNNPIGNNVVIHSDVESCDVTGLFNDHLSNLQEHHLSARSLIKKIFKHIAYDP